MYDSWDDRVDALEQENEDGIVGDLVRINLSEVIFTAEHWGMKECSLNFLRVCGRVKRPSSSFVSAKFVKNTNSTGGLLLGSLLSHTESHCSEFFSWNILASSETN